MRRSSSRLFSQTGILGLDAKLAAFGLDVMDLSRHTDSSWRIVAARICPGDSGSVGRAVNQVSLTSACSIAGDEQARAGSSGVAGPAGAPAGFSDPWKGALLMRNVPSMPELPKVSRNVTKKDLIESVVRKTNHKRPVVREVVESLLDSITLELGRGRRIELRNFGIFMVRLRRERAARNPKTKDRVNVPEKPAVKFKAGRDMRAAVEGRMIPPSDGKHVRHAAPDAPIVETKPLRANSRA